MTQLYRLSGKPVPCARPRLSKGHAYDSQSKLKEAHSWEIIAQKPQGYLPPQRPLQFVARYYMPMPKSWSKIKQDEMVGKAHAVKCDLDNAIKYTLDVCNGLLINDDAQVSSIHAQKVWAFEGSTTFKFLEIL